jgi:putative ABC transport system permease protein
MRPANTRTKGLLRRLGDRFRRTPARDEIDSELEFHLEMQTRRYIATGMHPAAARAEARRRLGRVETIKEECAVIAAGMSENQRRRTWWRGLGQDVAYSVRVLRKSPLFTTTALVTLAVGIGATTAIFSVVETVLLASLPYSNVNRVMVVWNSYAPTGLEKAAVSPPEFLDITAGARAFDRTSAISSQQMSLVGDCAGGPCDAEQVTAYLTSPSVFETLGVTPALGRPFSAADGRADTPAVVMLTDALWRRRYGANPSVVGQTISLAGRPVTVVGILPQAMRFPEAPLGFIRQRADVWVAYDWSQRKGEGRGNQYLAVLARLGPGVTSARARQDLDLIADRFRAEFPSRYAGADRHWHFATSTLHDEMVGDVRPALVTLLGSVGLVLLIACVNVAHLLLARGATRRRELAVRSALGATRVRLVRQVLVESLVLTSAAGVMGVALATSGIRILVALDPGLPRIDGARVDGAVLAFSAALTLLTGLLVGLVPALRQARANPQAALAGAPRGSDTATLSRSLRQVLVVAEVALALVVLVGTGLLVRSFSELQRVRPAFDPGGLLTFQATLPRARYDTSDKVITFQQDLADRLAAVPGVASASAVYPLPLSGERWSGSFFVEDRDVPAGEPEPHAEYAVVMPSYFSTMRIRLVEGREFSPTDTDEAPKVVVVDDSLARRYWPGESAVGKRLNPNGPKDSWATVVGVAAHVRNGGPRDDGEPQIYQPIAQRPEMMMFFVARTDGDPLMLAGAAQQAMRALDPTLPAAGLGTMDDLVLKASARDRFTLFLFLVFGGVSLTLAAVGLYGVMAYLVTERARDIGIRLALGGSPGRIVRHVVGEGLTMTLAGVAVGWIGARLLSGAMASLLFATEPTDPATYAGIAAIVVTIALIACYLPARRAMRVNPLDVLRS